MTDPTVIDPPATTPPEPPVPVVDLLSEPTFEECIEEWVRYSDGRLAGQIPLTGVPEGHHVAYYAGRIRGHDTDQTALRERAAAALGIHPARLVIDYPWAW